jgi:hypothetical protein
MADFGESAWRYWLLEFRWREERDRFVRFRLSLRVRPLAQTRPRE